MKTIELHLVTFNGFYESIWSADYDYLYEDLKDMGITHINDWEIKTDEYQENIVSQYIDEYQSFMKNELGLEIIIKGKELVSPKYYNYSTDCIYCQVEIDENTFYSKVRELMITWKDELTKVIKENHTSRDGFVSFMSNDFSDWYDEIDSEDTRYLSYAIGYLIELSPELNHETFDNYIYYDMDTNVWEYAYPETDEAKKEYDELIK